jgi:hypothetical protein
VELADAVDGWLRHNGKIDSMPEVVLDWFDRLVVKRAKDKMVSIAGGEGSIAWCGSLLLVQTSMKLLQSLDSFYFLSL